MKILYVISSDMRGGAERIFVDLLENQKREHEITILVTHYKSNQLSTLYSQNCAKVVYLDYLQDINLKKQAINEFILSEDFEYIHIFNDLEVYTLLPQLKKECKSKIIGSVFMDCITIKNIWHEYFKKYNSYLYKLTSDSNINKPLAPQLININTGIPDFFSSKPKMPNKIVFIGRFTRPKGFDVVLKLAESLKEFSFNTICGKREAFYEYMCERDFPNLTSYINLSRREVSSILETAQWFILPSTVESTPISLLEAMASGCIPVCTPCGNIPQIIGKNRGLMVPVSATAFAKLHVVEPKTPVSIKYTQKYLDELITLFRSRPKQLDAMSNNAVRYIRDHHNFSEYINNYQSLYV